METLFWPAQRRCRPLRHALQHAERNGVPVQIWIHAPEEEAASFDSWGCPLPEEWSRRPIPIRDGQIRIAANPARLAEETCRIIARTAEGGTPDIALGVCDPDMNVALDAALRQYGWGLHNPEGKPLPEAVSWTCSATFGGHWKKRGRRAPSIPWRAPPCSAPPWE